MFPSRLNLGSGSGTTASSDKVLQQQMKEIKNIFRRVYRIYAHAWFQHREMFWRVESKTGLYVFFKMVCDEYGIIESENYTIPAEAEGLEPEPEQPQEEVEAPSLLKRDQESGLGGSGGAPEKSGQQETFSMGDTTKRHRHTMSDFSNSVDAVIQEEAEEEESSPDKPSLARQSTALRDMAEEPEQTKTEEAQDDEPVPGIARSDTLKAAKEGEEVEEGEQTVLETTSDETPAEDAGEGATTEDTRPQDQPAAEGEDAAKAVGD